MEESGVEAYIRVKGFYSTFKLRLKTGDEVRVVESEKGVFKIIHAVRGHINTLCASCLTELIHQGHLLGPPSTAILERNSNIIYYWFKVSIRRQSVELISTRFFRGILGVVLDIRIGIDNNTLNDTLRQLSTKWKTSNQLASSNGLNPPSDVIKVELYEHQKQGLSWMLHREQLHIDELPPFWEEKNGAYRSLISSFITLRRPQHIIGGILADESRMGKTLTLLSLIAYTKNKCEHTNTAEPAAHVRKKHKVADESASIDWRPTLVVCPPPVLAIWKKQIELFTWQGSLTVCTYFGKKNLTTNPNFLRQHDIVLTTYNIVKKEDSGSVLNQIEWWRVILDDAHVLKRPMIPTTPFINLKAKCRWAITGKPLHKDWKNYDLCAIIKFLQVEPYFSCHYSLSFFPVPLCSEILMGVFSLRRTIPRSIVENHMVVLSNDEQAFYDSAEAKVKATYEYKQQFLHAAVLNLWQICNGLIPRPLRYAEMISSSIQDLRHQPELLERWVTVLQKEEDYACPVCMDQPEDHVIITGCSHMFCTRCIVRMFQKTQGERSFCPLCRSSLTKSDIFSPKGLSVAEHMKSLMEDESSSANVPSKVAALVNLLLNSRAEAPNMKSVVFSQFQKMVSLLAGALSKAGFNVKCINMIDNTKTKAKACKEFINAKPPVIFLTTFKALSDMPNLDLSAASSAYLIEPCWNVLAEDEALSRIYHPGKEVDVHVVRLVCKNSIEERALKLLNVPRDYGSLKSRREVNVRHINDMRRLLGL